MAKKNRMLTAALAYARDRGWPVHPVQPGGKAALVPEWQHRATTDPAQIEEWWTRWPDANIAVCCGEAGLLVVDVDPGADTNALEEQYELTETLAARTPRGGEHIYYELDGEIVANSTSRIAPHVDVRSHRGYALLPPSRTKDGTYEWANDERVAPAPPKLLRACNAPRERHDQADEWIIEPDLPENVALAIGWLRGDVAIKDGYCQPAIQGRGGDNATYAAIAMARSCGLSDSKALEVVYEHFNPRCEPPWDHDDLLVKVGNAYRYATSPPGNVTRAHKEASQRAMFTPVERDDDPGVTQVGRFRFLNRDAVDRLPPLSWLIPDFLPNGAHALLVGHSGSYKSFIALDAALTVATGGGHEGALWEAPADPGPVLYVAGEGFGGLGQRVRAWEQACNGGQRVQNLVLSEPVPRVLGDGEEVLDAWARGALARCPGDGYRLVVLDTVGRSLQGANENAQEVASGFTALVERVRFNLDGPTILGLHHTGRGDPSRARGSSVLDADADTVVVVEKASERLSRMVMQKQKDAPEWDEPRWASMPTVHLSGPGAHTSLVAKRGQASEAPLTPKARKQRQQKAEENEVFEKVVAATEAVLRASPTERGVNVLANLVADYEFTEDDPYETGTTVGVGWSAVKYHHARIRGEDGTGRPHPLKEKFDAVKQIWRW